MPDEIEPVDKETLTDLVHSLVDQGHGTDALEALRRINGNKLVEAREIANGDYKYWAFISYSHKDAVWGDWVHRTLENYRVPTNLVGRETSSGVVPKRVFPIFRDREELGAASELTDEIEAALESSRFLVVICSVASAKSHWVGEEIKRFKSLYGSQRVLCIIVDGEPNAWDGSEECFPDAIRYEVTPGGELTNQPCEPIAADARPQGDGRFNAKLKLLAGLLGVRYDELRQREKIRRRRNRITWTSMTVATLLLMSGGGIYLYRATDANRLVDSLQKADTNEVSGILSELSSYPSLAHDDLVTSFNESADRSDAKLHAALALLGRNREAVPYVRERLLDVSADQFIAVRDLMDDHKDDLVGYYWEVVAGAANDQPRFRAACALAYYDPQNETWQDEKFTAFVADFLVGVLPSELPPWRDALRPVREQVTPALAMIYRDERRGEQVRSFATDTLGDYLREDFDGLFELLMDAEPTQFTVLFDGVARFGELAIAKLEDEVRQESDSADNDSPVLPSGHPPSALMGEHVNLARRKANAAAALARLTQFERLFPALRIADNPESLTQFVHRCRDEGVTAMQLLACLRLADDHRKTLSGRARLLEDRVVFGLLLALGEFSLNELPQDRQQTTIETIGHWYRDDPRSAIHGAAGWLLRQWGQVELVRKVDQTPRPYDSSREWFTLAIEAGGETFYQTYIVIFPGEYTIGSPEYDVTRNPDEALNRVRLTRPIALLDREVTRREFEYSGVSEPSSAIQFAPTDDHPMLAPSWYESVQYCRWLTKRFGLSESEQAYADPSELNIAEFPRRPETGLPQDWPVKLDARGFRLPTEAEWEVAARGDMHTAFSFGQDVELLGQYGWYQSNSGRQSHVAKQLRPNLRGLFDMQGNAYEWCHDWYADYPLERLRIDPTGPTTGSTRVVRGGSWNYVPADCRPSDRLKSQPNYRNTTSGVRIAIVPFSLGEQAKN